MSKLTIGLLLLIFCFTSLLAQTNQVSKNSSLKSMVEAEREFAHMAKTKNYRDAFVTYLAEDSIVFNPTPTNGQQVWQARKQNSAQLFWQPIYAEIADSGELGYTTGPWEFRQQPGDKKPAATGNFMSVWRKQSDGHWRVALDVGVDNPPPTTNPTLQLPNHNFLVHEPKPVKKDVERDALLKFETEMTIKNWPDFFTEDVRLLRDNVGPIIGKASAREVVNLPGSISWQPIQLEIAQSGDFAYCYGTYQMSRENGAPASEHGIYVRVWRNRVGLRWQIIFDLLKPIPEKS